MERYESDRSLAIARHLAEGVSSPVPDIFNAPIATDHEERLARELVSSNGLVAAATEIPPQAPKPLASGDELFTRIHNTFDEHLRRLERLKESLRKPFPQLDVPETENHERPRWIPERSRREAPPSYLLHETRVYLYHLEHPPLLPPPQVQTFEEAFKRHEPMFHTVFYRKYPPWVLDDAKQEGLLALFCKWLKNKAILDQSSAYVTTAAIYGVSNWRQKGMKVRAKELALLVDAHGKVMGEPRAHSQERWTDRIDLKLDVSKAVEVVLYQYREQPEYREIYRVVEYLRGEVLFTEGQRASGLSLRTFIQQREQVKARLREHLMEYAEVYEPFAR